MEQIQESRGNDSDRSRLAGPASENVRDTAQGIGKEKFEKKNDNQKG
jgi:hypothetical protein